MADIIAIVNQKGGVGKTTTAINVAACLAAAGKKTLLIDADVQGNSTSGLGVSRQNLRASFYNFLMDDIPLQDVIMETSVPDLHIVPTNRDLLGINQELVNIEDRNTHFRRLLENSLQDDSRPLPYEFILIDSPPNLDILSINIMAAANRLIIPTLPEYLSLEGLADLIDTYKRIRETINPRLSILGVLITKHISTNNLSKEVTQDLRKNMGSLVFDNVIPQNVKVAEAPSFCLPIILYDPKSSGSMAYQAVTKEILSRTGNND